MAFISIAAKAKPIKLFEPLEGVYHSLGIQRSGPKLTDRTSLQWCYLLGAMITYSAASLAFCMFKAKTVAEKCDTFYNASTNAMLSFQMITYILEAPKLCRLIEKFESFFMESK